MKHNDIQLYNTRWITIIICLVLFLSNSARSQEFEGTWKFIHKPNPSSSPIYVEMQIGKATEGMLYPANLKINYNSFSSSYEFLLVKKNDTQLGIGRNKYPILETPFKIGQWMPYLNGVFTFSKDAKGKAQLELKRMWIDNFGFFMRGLYDGDEIYLSMKDNLRNLLCQEKITFQKANSIPWSDPNIKRIVSPTEKDSIYYGVYDPITLKDSIIYLTIQDEELMDADTITLVQNGKIILNKHAIDEKEFSYALPLKKGMNTLALFAENYGRLPPNTGNLIVKTKDNMYSFDFTHRANAFATFLVGKFYRETPDSKEIPLKQTKKESPPKKNDRYSDYVAEMEVKNDKISLEIWDGQVEDGDIISLKLNDEWIEQNIKVQKKGKKIEVLLKPGKNILLFRAENLGTIPPNTAVLRIYYGDKTRYVYLSTDMKKDNLIEIDYKN
ncbi:hypothetical protein [Flavobacterium sp. '19STA2R22 D10 B1']|uniref:hypothetical protein n=1 Tax=Flavobacterium aerium TaxID=3037261 RepID=UPI00278BB623|nr:hypothetical protein [Flavobacterium sp. '19STA2R22 D10 B1']